MAVPPGGAVWRGRVRAVFARCVHAVGDDGVCLTLGRMSLPAHPYSILWAGFPEDFAVGQEITVTVSGIAGPYGPLVSLEGMPRYTPSLACRPMARLKRRLGALTTSVNAAAHLSARGGFHRIFRHCSGPAPSDATSRLSGTVDGLERRLGLRLAHALRLGQWEDFARAAREMAGLGIGLTPAGDDFLAGVLAALRYHGRSRGRAVVPKTFLEDLAASLSPRTTPFSGFLLCCAARGLLARPMADWLAAVHAGEADKAAGCVSGMAAMGHSSGLDTFLGMLLALQILMGERPWIAQ